MKRTLLDLTQTILSSLSSDEVNSISDTTESLQVAEIIKTTYFNIIARAGITDHKQLIQLDPSLDINNPVLMFVPAGIGSIEWLKYFNSNVLDSPASGSHGINTDIVPGIVWSTTSTSSVLVGTGTKIFTVASATLPIFVGQVVTAVSGTNSITGTVISYVGLVLTINATAFVGSGTFASWTISSTQSAPAIPGYQYVTILPITQFLDMTLGFNPANSNVETFTFHDNSNNFDSAYTFYFKNDKQPQYCTILSNYYVIFDGFDNTQDSTLQSSKTMALGTVIPAWTMTDTFIPNLSEDQFPLLLNEAKSLAYFELKQSAHPKAEQEAKRGWSSLQKTKSIIDRPTYFDALPNFGRRGAAGSSFFKRMGWDRQ